MITVWLLIILGATSLLFGWPWGDLVGAILLVGGIFIFAEYD